MFVKLAVLACTVAVALGAWHGPLAGGSPADKYPAGVSPQACPNYPHCSNPAVAANPSAPSHGWNGGWNGGHNGGWNGGHNGGWNGGHNGGWNGDNGGWNGDHGSWNQNALDRGEYTGDGDYHGEGLAESGAYGDHQSWAGDAGHGGWAGAGAGGWAGAGAGAWGAGHGHAAQVPAGVDPHSCPNYPFCH